MNTPIALVGAAAALLGALVGGITTLMAGRFQWRRESRREAYAQLLTVSHEVRWWLEGHQPNTSASNDGVDPIRRFFSTLDAASVIASYSVQVALDDWATVAGDLPELSRSTAFLADETARRAILRQWLERQTEFHVAAKHELGIKGERTYSRRAFSYATVTVTLLSISMLLLYAPFPSSDADNARLMGKGAFGAAVLALFLATGNALRADTASRKKRLPLQVLGPGLALLFLVVIAPVLLVSGFQPWMVWIHVPGLAALLLGLAAYWVSESIEKFRSLRRWIRDKEQRRSLKHQEAKQSE
jgi:hypothetical protein